MFIADPIPLLWNPLWQEKWDYFDWVKQWWATSVDLWLLAETQSKKGRDARTLGRLPQCTLQTKCYAVIASWGKVAVNQTMYKVFQDL